MEELENRAEQLQRINDEAASIARQAGLLGVLQGLNYAIIFLDALLMIAALIVLLATGGAGLPGAALLAALAIIVLFLDILVKIQKNELSETLTERAKRLENELKRKQDELLKEKARQEGN